MKELKIETGGRPYRNEDFALLQAEQVASWALALADYVATIDGKVHGFVLSGCQLSSGGTLSPGLVYLGGRLLRVAQTTGVSASGYLVQQAEDSDLRPYKNGVSKACQTDYTAVYQLAEPAATTPRIALNSIRRLADLQTYRPQVITMWAGNPASLPHGVQLCDGTNGTPNLKGRFVVGYDPGDEDYNQVGDTGGAKRVALTTAELPSHSHAIQDPGHNHSTARLIARKWFDNSGEAPFDLVIENEGYPSYGGSVSPFTAPLTAPATTGITATEATGGGEAHENRPPYYALAFVTRVV